MNDSILTTIKKLLGIESTYTAFDTDLVILINSILMGLPQIAVGSDPVTITGATETWSSVLGTRTDLEAVKAYVYLKVKKIFDPPTGGSTMEAYNDAIKELEFRIMINADKEETTNA